MQKQQLKSVDVAKTFRSWCDLVLTPTPHIIINCQAYAEGVPVHVVLLSM